MNARKNILQTEAIVVGGGPCGLAAAIALQDKGINTIVIEKGNIVHALYKFPTHQTFFSTPEKLEIGGVPFIIEDRKPRRNQALAYYREVVRQKQLTIHSYETVQNVERLSNGTFNVYSEKKNGDPVVYAANNVIIATGYYDNHNKLNVPGAHLNKVFHYFKEAHPYFDQDVVIIGGKNSAVDATLELEKIGARVTVLYRGSQFSKSVKPWILPEFESLVRHEKITMEFNAEVIEITENEVIYEVTNGAKRETKRIKNDFVFAMIGYHPNHSFLTKMVVSIDEETGRPTYNEETMETNVPHLFIAGVIAAGNNANEIFIENGRFHGEKIAKRIIDLR